MSTRKKSLRCGAPQTPACPAGGDDSLAPRQGRGGGGSLVPQPLEQQVVLPAGAAAGGGAAVVASVGPGAEEQWLQERKRGRSGRGSGGGWGGRAGGRRGLRIREAGPWLSGHQLQRLGVLQHAQQPSAWVDRGQSWMTRCRVLGTKEGRRVLGEGDGRAGTRRTGGPCERRAGKG